MLREKLEKLNKNDLYIILGRLYHMSSSRIAKDLDVSRERIRQIRNRVNDKLNTSVSLKNAKRLCKRYDCKVWFVPKNSTRQFCSDKCQIAHYLRKRKWKKLEDTFIKLVYDIKTASPPFELKMKEK